MKKHTNAIVCQTIELLPIGREVYVKQGQQNSTTYTVNSEQQLIPVTSHAFVNV